MTYSVGDTLPFSSKLYDAAGALANATSATLTITLPDQTVATPTVTNPPAVIGTYTLDYPTTGGAVQAGRYVGVWLFTMATGKTTAYAEVFDVSAADPAFIVSLAQAKAQANIASTTSDDEIALYIASATRVVEWFVGPVVVRSYTQRVGARKPRLMHRPVLGAGLSPVLTLTSLTPLYSGGTSWLPADVVVDPLTGELTTASGSSLTGGPWTAVYTAGQRIVDANWQLGALIVIEHLWQTQRGASGLPLQMQDDVTVVPGLGSGIPNRARDLLQLDSVPGFA